MASKKKVTNKKPKRHLKLADVESIPGPNPNDMIKDQLQQVIDKVNASLLDGVAKARENARRQAIFTAFEKVLDHPSSFGMPGDVIAKRAVALGTALVNEVDPLPATAEGNDAIVTMATIQLEGAELDRTLVDHAASAADSIIREMHGEDTP